MILGILILIFLMQSSLIQTYPSQSGTSITFLSNTTAPPTTANVQSPPSALPQKKLFEPAPSHVFSTTDTVHDPSSTSLLYAVMLDAGSSGTRVHIFRYTLQDVFPADVPALFRVPFQHPTLCMEEGPVGVSNATTVDVRERSLGCPNRSFTLLDEVYDKVSPGLSHFFTDTQLQPGADPEAFSFERMDRALESLRPLLATANKVVPVLRQEHTPLFLRATAGLRLLPVRTVDRLLKHVDAFLRTNTTFHVETIQRPNAGVQVLDARDEGTFAWITVNYLLGTLKDHAHGETSAPSTLGMMDMGGASTQIVFEVPGPLFQSSSAAATADYFEHSLTLFGSTHHLYTHSYLGYGMVEARGKFHKPGACVTRPIHDAMTMDEMHHCTRFVHETLLDKSVLCPYDFLEDTPHTVIPQDKEISSTEQHMGSAPPIEEDIEGLHSCSFGGIYQPDIQTYFPSSQWFALSYFTDLLYPYAMDLLEGSPVLLEAPNLRRFLDADSAVRAITMREILNVTTTKCQHSTVQHPKPIPRWDIPHTTPPSDSTTDTMHVTCKPTHHSAYPCSEYLYLSSLLQHGYSLPLESQLVLSDRIRGIQLSWALGALIAYLHQPWWGQQYRTVGVNLDDARLHEG